MAEAQKNSIKVLGVKENITSVDDLPENEPLLFTGSFFTALIGARLFE